MGEEGSKVREGKKKESKLHDIKETASDTVEILRELATEDVRHSLTIIKEITSEAKEIMQMLNSEEMRKNIENMQLAAQAGRQASANGERISQITKDAGIIDEGKETMRIVKAKLGSGIISEQAGGSSSSSGNNLFKSMQEVLESIRETSKSITELSHEVKSAIRGSSESDSGIVRNIGQTAGEVRKAYENLKS